MKRQSTANWRKPTSKRKKPTQAEQIKTLQRKVNSMQRSIETKQYEFVDGSVFQTIGSGGNLSWAYWKGLSIGQGTSDNTRIGDQITVKELDITMRVTMPTQQITPLAFRIVIFRDKQHGNSTTISAENPFGQKTSIYENLGSGIDVAVMQPKWDMRNRYIRYRDFIEQLKPQVIADYDPTTGQTSLVIPTEFTRRLKIKIPNVKVQFTGSGNAYADVSTNLFQIGVYAVKTGGGINAPAINLSGRLVFQDM